jgi:branched-chain amino acid transport system ATP-binding protein
MSTGLSVRGLSAGYGKLPVIRQMDLSVEEGEIVAILGRNGAGKSTTLMAIAGLLPGTRGEIRVAGSPIKGSAARRCRSSLGLMLEGRSVFPSLTVAQNLQVGGVTVDAAVEVFPELSPRLSVKAGMLSGGEQQMLSLVRAMAREPRFLMLDELSFGLAPIVCDRLFATIHEVSKSKGIGVLLVEQHLHYAEAVADRVLVMHQGEIALEMPADQLSQREAEVERLYLGEDALE